MIHMRKQKIYQSEAGKASFWYTTKPALGSNAVVLTLNYDTINMTQSQIYRVSQKNVLIEQNHNQN